MHDFIEIDGAYIRASAIIQVTNSGGIASTQILLSNGGLVYTGLSIDEVLELISEVAPKPKNSRHSVEPAWRHRP